MTGMSRMTLSDALSGISTVKLSTSDVIAEQLRRAILLGTISGGAQLKQNDVAARFGVSVAPVREALQRLIADGLAILHPNRGVTVSPTSEQDFLEIAELRALLEPHALRHSAPRLTSADLQYSEDVLSKAAQASDPLERANLHWEFHRSLYKRAERPRLLAQIGALYQGINRYLLPAWANSGLSPGWVDSHLLIVAKIRDGHIDEACRLIVDQTDASTRRVQAHLHRKELSKEEK
ncbi:GntR family transcriptional regulator [Bradyrhizobium yuanmingense]|nr:GntR family transcriptional regulator [Bradyrhizobium yuanmingense]